MTQTPPLSRTVGIYVDGYNLYYGGRGICGRSVAGWRWLDIRAMAVAVTNAHSGWRSDQTAERAGTNSPPTDFTNHQLPTQLGKVTRPAGGERTAAVQKINPTPEGSGGMPSPYTFGATDRTSFTLVRLS
jgi:hypothetical protein